MWLHRFPPLSRYTSAIIGGVRYFTWCKPIIAGCASLP